MERSVLSLLDNMPKKNARALSRKKTLNVKGQNKKLDGLLCAAPSVIQDVLALLYQQGGQLLVQNIIDKKVPAYNCLFVKDLTDLVLTLQTLSPDHETYHPSSFPIDQEPAPLRSEPWMRNYLMADKQNRVPTQPALCSPKQPSERITFKNKASRALNVMLRPVPPKVPSAALAPIDLSEPILPNPAEDKLRQEKEKQVRQREEQRQKEQDRQEKQLEMQNNLQKQIKESKVKQFTYNFDGNLIMIKKVKSDKFPPQAYLVNYEVSEEKLSSKQKAFQKKRSKVLRPKRELGLDYMSINNEEKGETFQAIGSNFDQVQIAQGCTLKQDGKKKQKARQSMVANLLKEQNLMDRNLRMTRTDYSNFNKTINNLLSREELQQLLNHPKYPPTTHRPEHTEPKASPAEIQTVNLPLPTQPPRKANTIQINCEHIYQTITQQAPPDTEPSMDRPDTKKNTQQKYVPSQMDEFNIKMNRLLDWGKSNKHPQTVYKAMNPSKPTKQDIHSATGREHTQRTRVLVQKQPCLGLPSRTPPQPSLPKSGTFGRGIIMDQTAAEFGNISQIDKIAL